VTSCGRRAKRGQARAKRGQARARRGSSFDKEPTPVITSIDPFRKADHSWIVTSESSHLTVGVTVKFQHEFGRGQISKPQLLPVCEGWGGFRDQTETSTQCFVTLIKGMQTWHKVRSQEGVLRSNESTHSRGSMEWDRERGREREGERVAPPGTVDSSFYE
jgi:hypothetical protein